MLLSDKINFCHFMKGFFLVVGKCEFCDSDLFCGSLGKTIIHPVAVHGKEESTQEEQREHWCVLELQY